MKKFIVHVFLFSTLLQASFGADSINTELCAGKSCEGIACAYKPKPGAKYCPFHLMMKTYLDKIDSYDYYDIIKAQYLRTLKAAREAKSNHDKIGATKAYLELFQYYICFNYLIENKIQSEIKAGVQGIANTSKTKDDSIWKAREAMARIRIDSFGGAAWHARKLYVDLLTKAPSFEIEESIFVEECKCACIQLFRNSKLTESEVRSFYRIFKKLPLDLELKVKDFKEKIYSFPVSHDTNITGKETAQGIRLWTDTDGWVFQGIWKDYKINKEEDAIYLYMPITKETKKVCVSWLSSNDVSYVKNEIKQLRSKDLLWTDSRGWIPESQSAVVLKDEELNEKANKLLMDHGGGVPLSFKVQQTLDVGALCSVERYAWRDYMEGRHKTGVIDVGDWFYWEFGGNCLVANDEYVRNRRMFWAGTYKYETVKGNINTVMRFVDDKDYAIKLIRQQFNLTRKIEGPHKKLPNQKSSNEIQEATRVYAYGSGFIVSSNGYVVTNSHVIDGCDSVSVIVDNNEVAATVVDKNVTNDLAILRVNCRKSVEYIKLAQDDFARLGQEIFVIGFPRPSSQGFSPKVTKGVISGRNGIHDDSRLYQIDASIQPGNSGGPVCDSHGNLIGVVVGSLNSEYFLKTQGSVPQNVNYAIKKSVLLDFIAPYCRVSIATSNDEEVSLEDAVSRVERSTVLVKVYKE